MTHFIGGNHIKLLRNGAEYFPALEAAIDGAQNEVYLQTYIYAADATGMRIGNALMRAAQRGVVVNVLLDGFGCKDLSKAYIQELEQAGVQVMFYRPKVSPWTFKTRRLRRLHRKVVVIDGMVGFVGGINIIDDNDVPDQVPPRIDYAVRIEGALLVVIVESVYKLWRRMAWAKIQQTKVSTAKVGLQPSLEAKNMGLKAAFVTRDNVLHRRDIETAYLAAIAQAKSEIIIANAYFVPGKRFRQALLAAAARGVAVKLLLQGRKEYFLMFATHAFYNEFLNGGIEIYEYRKSFMHSKVAVVDNHWATVGSSNIDPFSLLLAHEANVVIKDKAFATELKTEINASIDGAHRITAHEWQQTSKLKHFSSWVAYAFVRVFLGIIGYSNE
jgi:cardiolipin synthase A/B